MIFCFLAANGTETVARKQPDGTYSLYGFKWFTSAADSDVALTQARVVDAEGQVEQVCLLVKEQGHSFSSLFHCNEILFACLSMPPGFQWPVPVLPEGSR